MLEAGEGQAHGEAPSINGIYNLTMSNTFYSYAPSSCVFSSLYQTHLKSISSITKQNNNKRRHVLPTTTLTRALCFCPPVSTLTARSDPLLESIGTNQPSISTEALQKATVTPHQPPHTLHISPPPLVQPTQWPSSWQFLMVRMLSFIRL